MSGNKGYSGPSQENEDSYGLTPSVTPVPKRCPRIFPQNMVDKKVNRAGWRGHPMKLGSTQMQAWRAGAALALDSGSLSLPRKQASHMTNQAPTEELAGGVGEPGKS